VAAYYAATSSPDNGASRNPSDSNVNPVQEEEISMKVSEEAEGEHSVEGEDQTGSRHAGGKLRRMSVKQRMSV